MPLALLYHDVTPAGHDDASGFPGAGAARYKLTPRQFAAHLAAIAESVSAPPLLTFDDGGLSAYTEVADILDRYDWTAHFFITANFIDAPAFLATHQIRELAARGHVIGSHSCTHPPRMSCCAWDQLVDEWARSREILSNILGRSVTVASVPGGYYSPIVAEAASFAGIRTLFTSEPTTRAWMVDQCQVLGRYTIYRGMNPAQAGALAAGKPLPRLRQAALWKIKKLAKLAGGRAYLNVRGRLLAHHYSTAGRGA